MHAVVNLDKPAGLTSRKAMELVCNALDMRKAGHAGTLDPIATGVLLVLLGEATKLSNYLLPLDKEYTATLKLGERTDTLDADGTVVERVDNFSVSEAQVEEALEKFRGETVQVPPMYSALKVSGKPLYKLARKGLEVERPPRKVYIPELKLLSLDPPFLGIRVVCSKGTYIRVLADDIGAALGTGACVTSLRRIRVGHFRADDAAKPGDLHHGNPAIRSVDSALGHLGEIVLSSEELRKALNGIPVSRNDGFPFQQGDLLRVKNPAGEIIALGVVSGKKIKVRRLLHLKS